MAGALLGFLVFNFYPAKIFMGDTGSLGVGFFLGCSAVLSADPLSGKVAMIGIPVLIFFLPLFDVALASFTRRWNGRPMMAGAKDHTSHRLVLLGMSERRAVLVLYLISAGGCGIAALWTSEWRHLGATMVVLYLVASAGLWLYLARIKMPGSWLAPRNPGALTVPEWLSGIADRVQKIGSAETPLVPERKAKVVRIIGRLNVGGPARQACYLHDRLHHAFHTVLITGQLAEGEGDMSHLLPAADNLYRVNAMSRSIRPWSDLKAFFSIVAILRRERPDIVHTHTAKAGALGRLAAILAGVPIRVHTYHGNVFEGYFSPFTSRIVLALERLLGKLTTRVIAISESQATELSERFQVIERERIVLIRTGFELLPFVECDRGPATRERLGVGPGEFLVLWSGRMEPIKNVQLLAAVIRAAQGNPRFRFLVAGAGTESAKFELLAGSCRNVIRTGWCWPMTDMISASDAVLLTSHNEGTPATLIEAMSAGKPFVATEVGGVPDLAVPPLLRRGVGQGAQAANGFLTALDPHLVLACLERLAADPELARAMGARGQRFALEMHSADRLREEIENLYFDLVAESSSSRLRNMTWDRGGNGVPAESRRQPEGGSTPNSKEERARSSSVSR
jgi:glycosyltransferase involved in cell wall biosynthesis